MLQLQEGVDILAEIGGINTIDEANTLFQARCDEATIRKLDRIKNDKALVKIANAISMIDPDDVFVNTGSEEDAKRIRVMSMAKGEEHPVAMKDHTVHFDLPQEQARIIDRTCYIVNEGEKTSVLAESIARGEALDYLRKYLAGIGKGRTLLIGFFSRGPIGAKAAIPALEITTSTYVMHSANILYRHVYHQFAEEVERAELFFTNVHSEGPNRPEDLPNARVFMDRSWLTTYSLFCTYAGNTLLLKKGNHRFAVDLATYYRREEELSEHMFVTGMTRDGRTTYFAGAAPSGCGKTTTAMTGTDFVGDDLAQLWIASDGTLRAINPEKGIFGIVQDVNEESDPYLMKALREEGAEVIWTNVLIDVHGVPNWMGNGEGLPDRGVNFQGEWWEGKNDGQGNPIPLSHPNARCTVDCREIGNYNEEAAEDPRGVEVRVITYGGRDSDTMPPVRVAKDVDHGVVIGASILSAATATEVGAKGVRRQPWANEPFIPGPLADYMEAQFAFFNSDKLAYQPIVAGLNYFLTEGARGGEGSELLGEKQDVTVWLGWLEKIAHGEVEAIETPIGGIPKYADLKALFADIEKDYPRELYDKQFALYVDNILDRIELQEEAYRKEKDVPAQLFEIYAEQREGLRSLKEAYGPVVSVEQVIEAAGNDG
ncbi:MAG: phosphoenolpyruvate carboxykinase (GTP) [Anaerolineae bacterium]|jgi:phosphoenolpyruvate carboxykinase (GTP)